jgi:hypothetical protein
MLDLKDLNLSVVTARVITVEIEHPENGETITDADGKPFYVEVVGEDSPDVRKIDRKHADKRAEKMRKGNIDAALRQDALESDRVERLTVATRGWYLPPMNGESLPFTVPNARRVYGDDGFAWITEQVEKAMRDRTRFFSTGSKP